MARTEHMSCPLCKRLESSALNSLETKLCEQCQAMINHAIPEAGSSAVVKTSAVQQSGVAELEQARAPMDQTLFELHEDASTFASWFDEETAAPVFVEPKDAEAATFKNEDPYYITEAQAGESRTPTSGELRCSKHDLDSLAACVNLRDDQGDFEPAGAAAADPWDNPLPAWECSRSEWPVLLGPKRQISATRHRSLFVAIALVVLAGASYLIYRPISAKQRAVVTTELSAQAPAAAVIEHPASAKEPGDTQNEAEGSGAQDSKPAQTSTSEVAPANEIKNVNGRFSLQAAAFPNWESANELAEKLKRAGVPSYLVAADIARRGRWYRVRVGGFNSAADAERFAPEAQMRARASGLSLRLIVCQYEHPLGDS